MDFEWDEAKRQANLRKHGFDFVDAPTYLKVLAIHLRTIEQGMAKTDT